jgi:hypothetical protein
MYDLAFPYFDNTLRIAGATHNVGYPFVTNEACLQTLIGLGQLYAAHRLAYELLQQAQQCIAPKKAVALVPTAQIVRSRPDDQTAVSALEQSIAVSESTGYVRQLAEPQSVLADIYR